MALIGASVADILVDTAWYTGVAGRTAASVSCCAMIAYCGYLAWNGGSEYSEVRTAGRPPSIEVYFWLSTSRRQRMASKASALCRVVLATARFSPPSVTLAGSPSRTAGYGAKLNTFWLAS